MLQHKRNTVLQEIDEISQSLRHKEEEEQKYIPLQRTVSALLSGEISWNGLAAGNNLQNSVNSPKANYNLQNAFQVLFPDAASKGYIGKQIADGLKIVAQVGLVPPQVHLLVCLGWLKATLNDHDAAWDKSRQLIGQIEEIVASLNQLDQEKKNLTRSIGDYQRQVQDLMIRVIPLPDTLQDLASKMQQLQRAKDALQHAGGDISSRLRAFFHTEVSRQSAGGPPFSSLKRETIFPQEIVSALQEDTSATFSEEWSATERESQKNITAAINEHQRYCLTCDWLDFCQKNFQQELSQSPEINPAFMPQVNSLSIPQPRDNASFYQVVSRIESNLGNIKKIRERSTGLLGRLFRRAEMPELQKLFLETHELLKAAYDSKESISSHIDAAQDALVEKTAAELRMSLQRWLDTQQNEVKGHYHATLLEKEQLEAKCRQMLQQNAEMEDRLADTNRAFDTSVQRLNNVLQELSRCADIPQALRRVAQESAASLTKVSSLLEEARWWTSDMYRLEMLVNELWGELQTAGKKVQ